MKIFLILIFVFSSFTSFSQALYSATGKASFYGKKFNGRKTANGEIFSNQNLTAAHKTLPFGTFVKVTNLKNNRSVIVRINDRGPYVKGRIIDLTKAAADSLDFIHSGWTTVKVEEVKITVTEIAQAPPIDNEPTFDFPNVWIGDWKGDLKIYNEKGFQKMIPMELQIHPTELPNRYSWKIVYDTSGRDYELVIRDTTKNMFSIDEKNGIDIMSYLLGNHFISRFEVDGVLLECEYTLKNIDEMTFSIRAGADDHHFTSGNVEAKNDTIPPVHIFPVTTLQFATLQRMNH